MKVAKNLTVEEAQEIAEGIEDIDESEIEKKMRIYQKRIANLRFFQKKPPKEDNK